MRAAFSLASRPVRLLSSAGRRGLSDLELEQRLRLRAAAGFSEGWAQAEKEKWGGMIHPFPPPTRASFCARMQSPRSRGRENPSRSRVGCCCCLSPALAFQLWSARRPTPSSAAGIEPAPPLSLPGGFWAFLQPSEAAGAPASLVFRRRWLCTMAALSPSCVPGSFSPTPRQRLSVPPKAVPPSLHALSVRRPYALE